MRILIISTFFPPLNSIASLRPYSWAKYWSQAGHDVTVLTTAKDYSSKTNLPFILEGFSLREVPLPKAFTSCKNEYSLSKSTTQDISNLQLYKNKLFAFIDSIRQIKGILNSCRMPDITDFWVKPALKEIENDPSWDLIISTSGPYTTHLVAAAIKKRGQTKLWVADFRDKWSDSVIYPGIFPFNYIETALERKIISKANAISTISAPFADSYSQKYPHTKVITIENGFDSTDLNDIDPHSIFNSNDIFRFVYTGSFYIGKQDPTPLFKAIASIKATELSLLDRFELLFIGNNLTPIQTLVDNFEINTWVTIRPSISRQDALRMQRDADRLLFLTWSDQSTDGIFTGKLFEYLYSQTPIIAIGTKEMEVSQKLILEANAGTCHFDEDEIKSFLENLLRTRKKHKNSIDPNILNRYNRKFLAMKLLKSIQSDVI